MLDVSGLGLPVGSIVVPFCGSYLGSYKAIPKRNYYGACGYSLEAPTAYLELHAKEELVEVLLQELIAEVDEQLPVSEANYIYIVYIYTYIYIYVLYIYM